MKVGIIGANGYGGIDLIRFLNKHPKITIEVLVSQSTKGTKITDQYPHLHNIVEYELEGLHLQKLASQVDCVFFATPAGISKQYIPQLIEMDVMCIDLSGDFRLKAEGSYQTWYKKEPAPYDLLQTATYGLTEYYQESLKTAQLISNPGCYATASLLGILPAIKASLVDNSNIFIDGKSGISGAGRKPSLGNIFSEVNENVTAYKLGHHQHTPEIEQTITTVTGKQSTVTFVPHLIPMTRGIMCTIYASLTEEITLEEVHKLYQETYKDAPFIRVRPIGQYPSTKEVYGTNFCDIGLQVDERTGNLIIVSVIDNLVKGAAGQAIQNMNVKYGWNETLGLDMVPIYP